MAAILHHSLPSPSPSLSSYAPRSNTTSHANHEKINPWVSFACLYRYWAPSQRPFGPWELLYDIESINIWWRFKKPKILIWKELNFIYAIILMAFRSSEMLLVLLVLYQLYDAIKQKSVIMAKSENSKIWIVIYNSSDSQFIPILGFLHDSPIFPIVQLYCFLFSDSCLLFFFSTG